MRRAIRARGYFSGGGPSVLARREDLARRASFEPLVFDFFFCEVLAKESLWEVLRPHIDSDWVDCGQVRFLAIADLAPGDTHPSTRNAYRHAWAGTLMLVDLESHQLLAEGQVRFEEDSFNPGPGTYPHSVREQVSAWLSGRLPPAPR